MKNPWTKPQFKSLSSTSINSGTGTTASFELYVRTNPAQTNWPCQNAAGTATQTDGAPYSEWETGAFFMNPGGCATGAACTRDIPATVVCS